MRHGGVMAAISHLAETKVKVPLTIPEKLYETYRTQGEAHDRTPDDEMMERLKRCQNHDAMSGLYLDDSQRAELERILGHKITDIGVMLRQIQHLITLRVGTVEVPISPRLHERIHSRVFRGHTYESTVRKAALEGLEVFCGMR